MYTDRELGQRIASHFPFRQARSRYIRAKIASDPAYPAVAAALAGSDLPVWDGGCGLGLLAFYLRERGFDVPHLGVDLDAEKVAVGAEVARLHYPGVILETGSITDPPTGFDGHAVVLDVLHYLSPSERAQTLRKIQRLVATPGARCLIRFTARDRSWRYLVTLAEEFAIRGVGWIRGGRLCFPTIAELAGAFPEAEWRISVRPLWGRTPFNSYLLEAIKKPPSKNPPAHRAE